MADTAKDLIQFYRQEIDTALDDLKMPNLPESLYSPIKYSLAPGGKRIRPILCLLSYAVFSDDYRKAMPAALASEIFHTFTLLHDDIMDNAESRRGRQSVHNKWNDAVAILSGDMMMALSYRKIHECQTSNKSALNLLFDEMVQRLCEGQALDSDFENRSDVNLNEYLKMISFKTGALIEFCTSSGPVIVNAGEKAINTLSEFGRFLGRGFQLQDDLLDLTSEDPKWGKPIGGDLLEGKKTYLSLRSRELAVTEEDKEMMEAFFTGTGAQENQIDSYRDLFERLGVLEITKKLALENYSKAIDRLSDLPGSPARDGLAIVAEQLQSRLR